MIYEIFHFFLSLNWLLLTPNETFAIMQDFYLSNMLSLTYTFKRTLCIVNAQFMCLYRFKPFPHLYGDIWLVMHFSLIQLKQNLRDMSWRYTFLESASIGKAYELNSSCIKLKKLFLPGCFKVFLISMSDFSGITLN